MFSKESFISIEMVALEGGNGMCESTRVHSEVYPVFALSRTQLLKSSSFKERPAGCSFEIFFLGVQR